MFLKYKCFIKYKIYLTRVTPKRICMNSGNCTQVECETIK